MARKDDLDDLAVVQRRAGRKYLDPAHVPPTSAELTAARLAARRGREETVDPSFDPPRCPGCNAVLPRSRWGHLICEACAAGNYHRPLHPSGDLPPSELNHIFGTFAYSWNPDLKK